MKISRWLLLGVSHRYWNFAVVITNCQQFPNIHLTNGNASFFFYVDFGFPLSPTRLSPGFTISNMAGAIEKQELLNPREHMWGRVAHIFSFLFCVFCLFSDRSVSCIQCCLCLWIVQSCLWSFCVLCPVLPVSMDCPVLFVIVLCLVPSVANVYGFSSLVCNRSVSCAQCCQCLWIVQSCL